MDVVRALVGVHRLEVHHMADDMEVLTDSVAAVHVASVARDLKRLSAMVAFDE